MGRLIDADKFKAVNGMKDDCADCDKELRGKSKACEFDRVYTKMDFCGWLDDAPTVDAVEVVRCKDCTHWTGRKYNVHINGFLPWCRFSALQREANDFCSYGERKEDGSHEQRGEKA